MITLLKKKKTIFSCWIFNLINGFMAIASIGDSSGASAPHSSTPPVVENSSATAITIGKDDTTESDPKEIRPLRDIRDYAIANGIFLASSQDIDTLIQSFAPVSQADLDWKNAPSYPSPYITELKEITVIPGCKTLLTTKGEALSDEIYHGYRTLGLRPKMWDMDLTEGPFLHFKPSPSEHSQIPSGIHLTGEHEENYFHWIVEVLPRLFLFELLVQDKHTPILVTDGLHDNMYTLLDSICAPERSILKLQKNRYYEVKRLIYPSDLTRIFDTYDRAPGKDTTYIPVNLLREMAIKIKKSYSSPAVNPLQHIYIRRVASYRRLLNEMDIERLLVEKGFHIVEPGKLTIKEQIDLFSQADSIIGPSGAAMVNMLWGKPGSCITILHSDHPFKKYPYWDALARASGVKISYLAGPRAYNITDMFEAHDDYTISPEALNVALEKI